MFRGEQLMHRQKLVSLFKLK